MRLRPVLAALCCLGLAASARAADETYDLRGPARAKGAAYETVEEFDLKDGNASIGINGQTLKFKQSIKSRGTERVKFLAVDGRKVTKAETKIVKAESETTVDLGGEEKTEKMPEELEGETVLSELVDGKWKNTLVDTKPDAKQAKRLKKLRGPEDEDAMYPEAKVKVGHAWTSDAAVLAKILGDTVEEVGGKVKQKFVRVEKLDGEDCAVVESAGTITGKVDSDAEGVEGVLDMEFELKAVTYRSLKTGIDRKTTFEGTIKFSGKQTIMGAEAEVTVEGPVTGTSVTTDVKAAKE